MSLIIPRNFNRAKAQDAAAKDIKLPFIITFNNGKKEFREGYSEEEVRRRFDKSVAALYGGIKSVKLEDEDRRNGKDSRAADSRTVMYKGCRIELVKSPKGDTTGLGDDWIVTDIDGVSVGGFRSEYDARRWCDQHPSRCANSRAGDAAAADYDPNPQTRGKDIEVFTEQAIREERACENVLRKVIEDVEALVIKIHGPMSSWEEVIENSEMSPELPQAKKWSGTANRRYDYLFARERAISSILSELKRNHIN